MTTTALYPLRLLQVGLEATQGTPVAATQKLVGEAVYIPEIGREFEEFPRGVRAPVTGGGFQIAAGSTLRWNGNLTYEEATYLGLLGLVNDAVPAGSGPYTWDFTPVLTAPAVTKTATMEYVIQDGATLHYEREASFAALRAFTVQLTANAPATFTAEFFLRAEKASTVTGGLTPVTGRTQIPSNLFGIAIDDSAANLGVTPKTVFVRSLTLTVTTGLEPDYTLDSRADLDFTQLQSQNLVVALSMEVEHNGSLATELTKWRGTLGVGALRFIRITADNGQAAGAQKAITFDGCFKYVAPPDFTQVDGQEIANLQLESEYDATWGNSFLMTLINGLAAQP